MIIRTVVMLTALSCLSAPAFAQELTDAQRSAIKSSCRADYMSMCAGVPTGTKESLRCLVQHSEQVSQGCRAALAPAAANPAATPANAQAVTVAAAPAAPAAAAAAAPAATTASPPAQQLSPREEAHVLRAACGSDFQKFCSDVRTGGGRGIACLRAHGADLTPACRSALRSLAPQ